MDGIQEAGAAMGLPFLLVGACFAFFGLKLFKCMLCLIGFSIGAIVGGGLGIWFTKDPQIASMFALIFGIAAGFVVMWARRVAYFVFGAGLGCGVAVALTVFVLNTTAENLQSTLMITSIILGIPGGILAVYIGDYIVIACTGVSGGANMAIGLAAITGAASTGVLIIYFLISAGLGIWFQVHNMAKWKHATAGYGHNVAVTTEVNTSVTTNNTVEVLIQAPQSQQYPPMYPSQPYPMQQGYPVQQQGYPVQQPGYPTPYVQNPYPAQPGYGQPQQV